MKPSVIALSLMTALGAGLSGVAIANVETMNPTVTVEPVNTTPIQQSNMYSTPQQPVQQGNMYSTPQQPVQQNNIPQQGNTYNTSPQNTTVLYNPPVQSNGQVTAQPAYNQSTQSNYVPQDPVNAAPVSNPYGVPDENVIPIQGKVIKYSNDEKSAVQQAKPLNEKILSASPQQIQKAQKRAYDIAHALEAHPNPGRCDKVRSIKLSTDASSPIPTLRMNVNNSTNIVVSDSMGNAWDIDDIVYVENDLSVVSSADTKHVKRVSISPVRIAAQGSFSMELRGVPVPLVTQYVANQKVVDCLVHIRVDGLSPTSKAQLKNEAFGDAAVESADSELLSVVMGMKPENGKELKTSVPNIRAWKMKDGTILVRSRYDVVSPAPLSGTSSPDGTKVVRIRNTNVVTYRNNDKYEMVTFSR